MSEKSHTVALEKQEILVRGCAQLGVSLSPQQIAQLLAHLALLEKWNRRYQLTAISNPRDMVVRHCLDSLATLPFLRGATLLDIGSGGGFPGLPLAIAAPQMQVTLLDRRARSCTFLNHARTTLKLSNVRVLQQGVEGYARRYDTLICRAFAPLPQMLELTAALHQPGSRLLAMLGKLADAQIAKLAPQLPLNTTTEVLRIPFLEAQRHLLVVQF